MTSQTLRPSHRGQGPDVQGQKSREGRPELTTPHPSLLVVLGAGASAGLAPSTADLTQTLHTWRPDGICGDLFAEYWVPATADVGPVTLTFEDLIEVLDQLCAQWHSAERPFYSPALAAIQRAHPIAPPSFAPDRLQALGAREDSPLALALSGLAHEARMEILSRVGQAVALHPAPVLAAAPVNQILRRVGRTLATTIVSLNYDSVLDSSGLALDHGFTVGEEDHYGFDPTWEVRDVAAGHARYMPLHGSVHFGFPTTRPSQLAWYPDSATAETTGGWHGTALHADRERDLLMVTGHQKTRHLMGPPYSSYMAAFRRTALVADRWLIIGYGRRDPHVNATLTQGLAFHVAQRRSLAMVVISYGLSATAPSVQPMASYGDVPWLVLPQWAYADWAPVVTGGADGRGIGWAYWKGIEAAAAHVEDVVDHLWAGRR